VKSKFKFTTNSKHSHYTRDKTKHKKPLRFKVCLLRRDSVRTMYKNRLNGKLTPITGKVEIDWLKIK
jgi:hypothetical protein